MANSNSSALDGYSANLIPIGPIYLNWYNYVPVALLWVNNAGTVLQWYS